MKWNIFLTILCILLALGLGYFYAMYKTGNINKTSNYPITQDIKEKNDEIKKELINNLNNQGQGSEKTSNIQTTSNNSSLDINDIDKLPTNYLENETNNIPYCSGDDCGLKEGIDAVSPDKLRINYLNEL